MLNPCLDRYYTATLPRFGRTNRITLTGEYPAGKAVNVSLALKNLGLTSLCIGFNAEADGSLIADRLTGVDCDFVPVSGRLRVNTKIYDENGKMTEFNETGKPVAENFQQELLHRFEVHCKNCNKNDILVISGSSPLHLPEKFYQKLLHPWHGKVIIDTSGSAFKYLLSLPKILAAKPNIDELNGAFGTNLSGADEIVEFCLKTKFARLMLVSMGEKGSVLVTKNKAYHASPLRLEVKGLQGAGDSMVAGMVYALDSKPPEILKVATAAAAASIIRPGTELCTFADFTRLYNDVIISEITPKILR